MEDLLNQALAAILPPDAGAMAAARAQQDALAKPPHSLGKLEDLSVKLAGITGRIGAPLDQRRVLIFAADNGVAREGVSSCPQSVTLAQTINFTRGVTGAAVLTRHFGAELDVIDVGIDSDLHPDGVRERRVARGTRSFVHAPAMTREQALQAMTAGIEAAERAAADGIEILGVGEMGIGNTTTSAAALSCLLGLPAVDTVSRGSGIDDDAFRRKIRIVDEALARWTPDPRDPVDVLAKVGGFDLAAMCGAFVGAAKVRIPAVIDGFIRAVAALCAARLNPLCAAYMLPSHASMEKGHRLAMEALGLSPMLDLNMRLGEGSGCPLAFEIAAAAQRIVREMATFEEAEIDDGYLDGIRGNRSCLGEA